MLKLLIVINNNKKYINIKMCPKCDKNVALGNGPNATKRKELEYMEEVLKKLNDLEIEYELSKHEPVYTIEDMNNLDPAIFKGARICF